MYIYPDLDSHEKEVEKSKESERKKKVHLHFKIRFVLPRYVSKETKAERLHSLQIISNEMLKLFKLKEDLRTWLVANNNC